MTGQLDLFAGADLVDEQPEAPQPQAARAQLALIGDDVQLWRPVTPTRRRRPVQAGMVEVLDVRPDAPAAVAAGEAVVIRTR